MSLRDWGSCSYISVCVGPGATALTSTPCRPNCEAQLLVRFKRPALVMPYQRSGCPVNAATDPTFTMRPAFLAIMAGDTAVTSAAGASRLTARISRLCASGIDSYGSQYRTPALLTSVSTSPSD